MLAIQYVSFQRIRVLRRWIKTMWSIIFHCSFGKNLTCLLFLVKIWKHVKLELKRITYTTLVCPILDYCKTVLDSYLINEDNKSKKFNEKRHLLQQTTTTQPSACQKGAMKKTGSALSISDVQNRQWIRSGVKRTSDSIRSTNKLITQTYVYGPPNKHKSI